MVLPHNPLERRTLMSTTILSFQNRVVIETLHNEGRSLRYIANYSGFSKTTIFNELHRLNSEYQAGLAQTDFERKVSQRGRKSSLTKNLKHLIEEKIQVQKWSPEQVAHVVGIAYKTVYNWIDQGWLDIQLPDLPDHGIRRHRAKEKRGTFNHGRSIEERPHKVETRQKFGHFEADTVLSGKRKGQAVATFVERKSSLTIEHLTGTQVYFAHAYSPHERGSNENRNRVLRRFIPRGQAIEELSDYQLVQINWYLNSRPLKRLNWHTPIEIFLLNLHH